MKKMVWIFALAALAVGSAASATLPCFLTQIAVGEQPSLGNPETAVYAVTLSGMPSVWSGCRTSNYDTNSWTLTLPLKFTVERWNPDGYELTIDSIETSFKFDGVVVRRPFLAFQLPQGNYRVRSYNGGELLESLPFRVGSAARSLYATSPAVDDRNNLSYGQPLRVADQATFLYEGAMQGGSNSGYLYQERPNRTVVLPANFEQVLSAPSTASLIGFVRATISIPVGGGVFDPGLRVYGCPTGLGSTTCFPVYDPGHPISAVPFAWR